jgi:PGF-pre-PGF domain-containing protein
MKTLLFSTLLGMIILSSLVLATGSLSITSVTIPSSVSVGDSFTITMSVSGSEIQSNQATGSLTLPSQITCDKGSQTINLGTGGTGSTSWTCSASVAGDYTNQITASVTGTDSGTGGTLSDSQQTGLNVLSPASLTVSSTISSSSITAGSSVTFTVGVNNAGGQSTTYNITLSSSPTGLTFTPNNVSTTSIDGSTLKNNEITVTGSTEGSYTITATVKGGNGQTLTTNKSLTVSVASTTTTTVGGGDGGGGGGGGTTTEKKKSKTWDKITPGSAEIMHVDDPDIGLKMINITVKNPAQTVTITVTKLAGKPASVVHEISGKVYKYMEIKGDNINETHIDKVKIQFQVNKSWVSSNNINRATIALNRYKNNNWEKLTTKEISEDNDYVYYEAESPGFSTFAVTGEEIATTTGATTIATTTVTTRITTTIPPILTEVGGIPSWVLLIVIILIVIIVAVWLYQKRSSTK